MGVWVCFASITMTPSFIGISVGCSNEADNGDGHCEDPPVGGDEAIFRGSQDFT
jgi:hypothetical protein